MAKRIMREFKLDEISAVTQPAQKGARMVIMKREGRRDLSKLSADEIAELVLKGECALTSEVNGHSHLIDLDSFTRERGGGHTSSCWCDGDDSHSHPFVIGEGGKITIGAARGHTHEVLGVEAVKAAALPARVESTTEKGMDMDPKEIAKLQALAVMTDAQKAYFGKLGAADQEAFIAATPEQRAAKVADEVAKAAANDPVVYKAKDGTEYRKSDGDAAVKLAKSVDGILASVEMSVSYVKGATEASRQAEAERLAASWDHIGLPIAEKVDFAKGILDLPEGMRAAQLDTIAKGRNLMAPLFKSLGARDGSVAPGGDAATRLEALAKARQKETGEPYSKAYIETCRSPEGQSLYQETKAQAH